MPLNQTYANNPIIIVYSSKTILKSDAERQYQILLGVNISCLLSSLLLISTLNLIYLAVVLTLTAIISGIASVFLHVPNEAVLVPILYLGLVLILFLTQMNKEKTANVLYLKGL